MSGNSRKRRENKLKRPGRVQGNDSLIQMSPSSGDFNRMFRKVCSDCGSSKITWTTVAALAQDDTDPVRRDRAKELQPVLGASAEAWTCGSCEGMGAFDQNVESSGDLGFEMSPGFEDLLTQISPKKTAGKSPTPPRFAREPALAAFSAEAALRHPGLRCGECGSMEFWWIDIPTAIRIDPEMEEEAHASAAELGDDADVYNCAGCGGAGAIARDSVAG